MKRGFWWRKQGPSPLFPRQTRVRIHGAATGGIIYSMWILYGNAPWQFFVPARRFPTWFRWRRSGRKAESESGGDGLLANPRIVARRRFQPFGRRHRNRSGGFCCFSPSKSREKSFLCTFGAKSTKSLRTSFSAGVREPRRCTGRAMRHPVTDAPQPAPSFSASNESADSWCRQRRHYYTMRSGSPYQLTCPARLRLRVTFVSQNQPPSQLHFFFFRKAIPDLVPMAKKRTEG